MKVKTPKQIALDITEFMNTCEEWHAFVGGVCEVVCPWPPRHKPDELCQTAIEQEHHYYMFGRAVGIFVWLGIIAILKAIISA